MRKDDSKNNDPDWIRSALIGRVRHGRSRTWLGELIIPGIDPHIIPHRSIIPGIDPHIIPGIDPHIIPGTILISSPHDPHTFQNRPHIIPGIDLTSSLPLPSRQYIFIFQAS